MDIKEVIKKVNERQIEDELELIQDEQLEKYIEAFLKEENVIKQITAFISYCKARNIQV